MHSKKKKKIRGFSNFNNRIFLGANIFIIAWVTRGPIKMWSNDGELVNVLYSSYNVSHSQARFDENFACKELQKSLIKLQR